MKSLYNLLPRRQLWKLCQLNDTKAMFTIQDDFEPCVFAIIFRYIGDGKLSAHMTDLCMLAMWKDRANIQEPIDFLITKAVKEVRTYLLSHPPADDLAKSDQWLRCQKSLGDAWDKMDIDNKGKLRDLFKKE